MPGSPEAGLSETRRRLAEASSAVPERAQPSVARRRLPVAKRVRLRPSELDLRSPRRRRRRRIGNQRIDEKNEST